MKEIILTHPGKLGDALYALPVASWLYQAEALKTHWVLPSCFGPFRYIENLLLAQPLTSRVSLARYQVANYDCGGQPYRFNPALYGVPVEVSYYNLGFRGYPNAFIPQYYAEEHGFGYDPDYYLDLGEFDDSPTDEVVRSTERAMERLAPEAELLPAACDLLDLARRLKRAAEVHLWFCGLAVLCWLAGIEATVYRVPGHGPLDLYFPEPRTLTFKEVTL